MTVHKYDGLGNTFSIILYQEGLDFSWVAQQICTHDKLDTDGLVVVKHDATASPALTMLFYNRDGSSAPMCGNGIRAFASYVLDQGLLPADTPTFLVQTGAGVLDVHIMKREPFHCRINMGKPIFTPQALGLKPMHPLTYTIQLYGEPVTLHMVFMGTIHAVVFVNHAPAYDRHPLGEAICNHPMFKEKTNVNFTTVNPDKSLTVRTYERGVGYTKACGTGCCAAFVIAKKLGLIDKQARVHLALGQLYIEQQSEHVFMTGPAQAHFSLTLDLPTVEES